MNKKGGFLLLVVIITALSAYQYLPWQINIEQNGAQVGNRDAGVAEFSDMSATDTSLIATGKTGPITAWENNLVKEGADKLPISKHQENGGGVELPLEEKDSLPIINQVQNFPETSVAPIAQPESSSGAWQPTPTGDESAAAGSAHIPSSPEEFQMLYPEQFQQIQHEYQWVEDQAVYYPTLKEFLFGLISVFFNN